MQKVKKVKKMNIVILWDKFKQIDMDIIGIFKGERVGKKYLKNIGYIFLKLLKIVKYGSIV